MNDYKHDDVKMMAHFVRKTVNATIALSGVRRVDVPDLFEVHRIYEGYKRIFSVMLLLTRIIDGKTRFREKKPEIIRIFNDMTGTTIDGGRLLDFDKKSKDVFQWIHFFYHQDITSLRQYFRLIYAELEKIMKVIFTLPIHETSIVTRTWKANE